jgi:hypothetical protein
MLLVEDRLVCTCHECGAQFIVKTKPAIEKQKMYCACGSDLKKVYHPPTVTVYGKASEMSGLDVDLDEILAKIENRKRLLSRPVRESS